MTKDFMPCVAGTCHAVQGASYDGTIIICGWTHSCVDKNWLYTAVTRCTDLDKVVFVREDRQIWEEFKQTLSERATRAGLSFNEAYDLFKRQKFACAMCSGALDTWDFDHIVSTNRELSGNCQVLCATCNRRKASYDKLTKN